MRVFCREHEKGFFAPRQNPIKCHNRGHILGELNFTGDQRSPAELQWQYCCNCEHFCPISANGESLEHCPVCTRRTTLLYVCDRCFTISYESNTPLDTKNFTLTSEGVPQPACPGCLQTSSAEVRDHVCDDLGTSFTTALTTCPICRERLDIGPSFPNLASQFLRKTKATNKSNVTFDYDTGLFVEIEDGEFVVVPDPSEPNRVMVVPRLAQFSDPREFYEIYQDYYHHRAEIRAGEVFIHEPALGERADGGWTFKSQGLLEVVDDHPKRRAHKVPIGEAPRQTPVASAMARAGRPITSARAADAAMPPAKSAEPAITPARAAEPAMPPAKAAQPAITPVRTAEPAIPPAKAAQPGTTLARAAEPAIPPAKAAQPAISPGEIETEAPPSVAAASKFEPSGGVCQHCGSAIEDKYAFCWNCGKPMQSTKQIETKRPKNPSRRLIIDMNDVPDLPPLDEDQRPTSFSAPLPHEQKRLKRGNGSGLKLTLILMVAGVALVSGMVGMWWMRPSSQITTAALAAQTVQATSQSAQDYVPTVAVSTTPVETPLPTTLAAGAADEELRDLRQRSTKATAADRRTLMRDIARLEREYPNDYRFPYERAKLSAVAPDEKSRDAAFQALFTAAQRAIKAGKSGEMLHGLETDRFRDFRKLMRGRVEWAQLVQSLKNRDATLLATNAHSTMALE